MKKKASPSKAKVNKNKSNNKPIKVKKSAVKPTSKPNYKKKSKKIIIKNKVENKKNKPSKVKTIEKKIKVKKIVKKNSGEKKVKQIKEIKVKNKDTKTKVKKLKELAIPDSKSVTTVKSSTKIKKTKSNKKQNKLKKEEKRKKKENPSIIKDSSDPNITRTKLISTYEYTSKNIPITIKILKKHNEYVPIYDLTISSVSKETEFFLEKIRKELIEKVNLGMVEITDLKKTGVVEERFKETIVNLITKYFPDIDEETVGFLTTYLLQRSLGLGKIELLLDDSFLEEIAINSANEPIWVYHRKHAWVKTTVVLENEEQVRHYATMIGRKVGRQLTVLDPLLDASLSTGDRVNATLMPISHHGNTITLRKFASKPWTITDLISSKTISAETAAMVWLGLQYELSALITGGTAAGKTSMLNALATFFPPNHRIITIEDTREIVLPKFLHWVPMVTRRPNAEGKGGIAMIDLLVNSLRQRPDRIIVGEIRRKQEAETLFEAIHTGHSVYATVHANSADETITRLTNPPIDIPKTMIPAISMILVQYRNRRSGKRKTFQLAEITETGDANVLFQYDAKKDKQIALNESSVIFSTIQMFTGLSKEDLLEMINDKIIILKWLVKKNINEVDDVGKVMAEYYTNKDNLMWHVNNNKIL